MTYFADDGYLVTACIWCGKPAIVGEKIEIVQTSSREALWMHQNCEQLYSEDCEKREADFYANVLKYVRGEPSDITPGTVGEATAKIAKDLIGSNPSLAFPDNLQQLKAAVEAVEHEHAVADGWALTLSDEEIAKIAKAKGVARERAIARAIAKAVMTRLGGRP
jgi:hypothetical protein